MGVGVGVGVQRAIDKQTQTQTERKRERERARARTSEIKLEIASGLLKKEKVRRKGYHTSFSSALSGQMGGGTRGLGDHVPPTSTFAI